MRLVLTAIMLDSRVHFLRARGITKLFRTAKFVWLLAVAAGVAHAQVVTFNEHIAPIIYNNCSKCHHAGEVAPFSLMNNSDVASHGREIAIQTQSHFMPPWKPEPGWTAYRDER